MDDEIYMIKQRYNFSVLESALPKLIALQSIYVGRIFHSQNKPFYYDSRPYLPNAVRAPTLTADAGPRGGLWAIRESMLVDPDTAASVALETVLKTLLHTERKPSQIHASVHWRFFKKPSGELLTFFQPLAKASVVELYLSIAVSQVLGVPDIHGFFIPPIYEALHCFLYLANTGGLRAILQTMTELNDLRFSVQGRQPWDVFFVPISLDIVIAPGFHWHNLTNLALTNVKFNRKALWKVLEPHKDTLTLLHLQEITFEEWGSWRELLPDIRNHLCLQDANFTKYLRGYTTEDGAIVAPEEISLGSPQLRHAMRESLNCYCRYGSTGYPDELPLTCRVV